MSAELVELRSFYSPPGTLLLAREGGDPAGCVGLRALGPSTGEVRRLYVRPGHRGNALGSRLMDAVLTHARGTGLRRVVLNTLPTMTAAHSLYTAQGFGPVEPYVDDPVEGVQALGRAV